MSTHANGFLDLLSGKTEVGSLVIAHRGDSFRAPENTLEAAQLAHEAGAPAWELDVQLTRDGVPIVLHDDSLARTTDVSIRFANDRRRHDGFRVSDFTLAEVQTLDAGSWFVDDAGAYRSALHFGTHQELTAFQIEHYRSGSVRIPTLAEALELTRSLGWLVNVEIKSFPCGPPGIAERVLEQIAAIGLQDRVLISSFDHADFATLKALGCKSAIGALTSTPLFRTADYVADFLGADTFHTSTEVIGADSIAYRHSHDWRDLRCSLVAELSERGIPTLVYTVNSFGPDGLATALRNAGVAAIFTDDPSGCRQSEN